MDEWNTLPWRRLERSVFKLQQRIYRASNRGDVKTVHKLQRLLLNSRAAKLLAVRKSRRTIRKENAGVDGVKSLTPSQRLTLSQNLKLDGKARPVRRSVDSQTRPTERAKSLRNFNRKNEHSNDWFNQH